MNTAAIEAAVHELRDQVDAEPKAGGMSRREWQAVLYAVTELHLHVREKLTSETGT